MLTKQELYRRIYATDLMRIMFGSTILLCDIRHTWTVKEKLSNLLKKKETQKLSGFNLWIH